MHFTKYVQFSSTNARILLKCVSFIFFPKSQCNLLVSLTFMMIVFQINVLQRMFHSRELCLSVCCILKRFRMHKLVALKLSFSVYKYFVYSIFFLPRSYFPRETQSFVSGLPCAVIFVGGQKCFPVCCKEYFFKSCLMENCFYVLIFWIKK